MNDNQLIEQLKKIVEPYVQNQEAFQEINTSTSFIEDLQINSAHLVDVILDIEDEFNVRIENEEMEQMINVENSLKIIQSKI
ncbi:acyl carrier protein [Psychroflexus maritimus]|uniref:Acyl carrier protein n=1 Tax=Psychroflexus maritimus TaxID=2714865 RepID=A0A967DYW1_9FLAO|nr:phosphopantetheine-binding protein [Psychroflexus maritimus]NGZ89553.1 acyl carrier protein [Psychroflexus maritimus]